MCSLSSSVPSCNSTSLLCKLTKFIYHLYSWSVLLNFTVNSSTQPLQGSGGLWVLVAALSSESTRDTRVSGQQKRMESSSYQTLSASGALLIHWDHFILFMLCAYANICIDAKICFIFFNNSFPFTFFFGLWKLFPMTISTYTIFSHPFYLFEYTESKYRG